MGYESLTIKDIILKIGAGEIYLPAIQRKFVWRYDQIENFFDSILRNYPIGTFLFWFLTEKINDYTFYKFLDRYHERDKTTNDIVPKPELKEKVIGILDGQQRLSSIYLALQGVYAYKKPYYSWSSDHAFPDRILYLNLIPSKNDQEKSVKYEFKFLTIEEAAKIDHKQYWFPVRKALTWKDRNEVRDFFRSDIRNNLQINEFIENHLDYIDDLLLELWHKLTQDKIINFYPVKEQELDNILDIFVRVNSGGTVLSKSDLLFSTIVAHWEDGRNEIEGLMKQLNKKGEGFWFNNDFIMRSCLFLSDCPVRFRVGSFKSENITKIKQMWPEIKGALQRTTDLLVEFGFNSERLASTNAVLPIGYYLIKGGSDDSESKTQLRKYLVNSLVNRVFSSQVDTVLNSVREGIQSIQPCFRFDKLVGIELPAEKHFQIDNDQIEEILEDQFGPKTFMILSLLYPHLKLNKAKFHQDHIHPRSAFSNESIRSLGVPEDQIELWKLRSNQLPNLMLLLGPENESKNNTPFKDWLYRRDASGNYEMGNIDVFKNENYIDLKLSLDFKDFEVFYETRKARLRDEIKRILQ